MTRRTLTRLALGAASLLVLGACAESPTAAPAPRFAASANATTSESLVPVHLPVRIFCSRLGTEIVPLDGVEHVTFQQAFSANGGHVRMHVNTQGVTGIGLVTGDLYRSAGATEESYDFDVGQFPFSYSTTYSFVLNTAGSAGHIVAHEVLRVDYDASGVPTVSVVKFDAECR